MIHRGPTFGRHGLGFLEAFKQSHPCSLTDLFRKVYTYMYICDQGLALPQWFHPPQKKGDPSHTCHGNRGFTGARVSGIGLLLLSPLQGGDSEAVEGEALCRRGIRKHLVLVLWFGRLKSVKDPKGAFQSTYCRTCIYLEVDCGFLVLG